MTNTNNIKKTAVLAAAALAVSPVATTLVQNATQDGGDANVAQAAFTGMQSANIQTGVLNRDMTDSTGYVYTKGTQVARASRDDSSSSLQGDFALVLKVDQVTQMAMGKVPAQYVTPTGSKFYKDVGANGVWASQSYVTNEGRTQTLKPVAEAPVVDKSQLQASINNSQSKLNGNFTQDSKAKLQAAIANGQSVLNNNKATQAQVNSAKANIDNAINGLTVPVSKDGLNGAIANAQAKMNGNFTSASKAQLQKAINDGKAVTGNANATQAQVDGAIANINNAVNALVTPADKSGLNGAIADAQNKLNGNFTSASKAQLQKAINDGKAVAGNDNATQAQVNGAIANVNNAVNGLVAPADTSVLKSTIADAQNKLNGDYTNASKQAVKNAIANGQAVLNNADATQAQVDGAVANIKDAVNHLTAPASKAELNKMISDAQAKMNGNFTSASKAELQKAIDNGKAVAGNSDATQDQVDAAASAIKSAEGKLVEPADTSSLKSTISDAQAKMNGNFTSASKAQLQKAIDNGKAIVNDENATQDQVNSAASAIKSAEGKLVVPADTTSLKSTISKAQGQMNGKFTSGSKAQLQGAIDKATAIANDENASQDQVDQAEATVNKAVDGLVELANVDGVNATIAKAVKAVDGDYTDSSKAGLQSAIDSAKAVAGNENASQDQVDKADAKLQSVVDALVSNDSIEKGDLASAIKTATKAVDGRYTTSSKQAVKDAIANGQKVYDHRGSDQKQVDGATKAINKAVDGLVESANVNALNDAILSANGKLNGDFTDSSKANLKSAIDAGKKLASDNDASQEQVDKVTKEITVSADSLVSNDDIHKTTLKFAIKDAGSIIESGKYTPATVQAVKDAIADGQKIYDHRGSDQDQVDGAVKAIDKALDGLTRPADRTDINKTVDKAKQSVNGNYTQASKDAVQSAIDKANAVINDENATQKQVDEAEVAVKDAVKGLTNVDAPAKPAQPAQPAKPAQNNGSHQAQAGGNHVNGSNGHVAQGHATTGHVAQNNGSHQAQGHVANHAQASHNQTAQASSTQARVQGDAYTVNSGDTLGQIAQDLNVSVIDLMRANPSITNPDQIVAGSKLALPAGTGARVAKAEAEKQADTKKSDTKVEDKKSDDKKSNDKTDGDVKKSDNKKSNDKKSHATKGHKDVASDVDTDTTKATVSKDGKDDHNGTGLAVGLTLAGVAALVTGGIVVSRKKDDEQNL